MFNTALAQVTYQQVVEFCRTFPEGVRVEYKREPVNIPKVISSFANTVGGIWVVGVDADKKTNRAVLPPGGVEGAGLEERIVQSAQAGVYPALTPAVRVFEIPGQPGRVLAVVKVPESIEAPHAIENSTRVWVRNASTTEPYELADIGRIEYLLKRRQEPERRREELIQRAAARSPYGRTRRVRIIVSPMYPRGLLLPYDDLYDRAETLEKDMLGYLRDFRTVYEGIVSTGPRHFLELNVYGVLLFEAPLESAGQLGRGEFVRLHQLLYPVGRVLNLAIPFLRDTLTNIMIRYELIGCLGIGFFHGESSQFISPGDVVDSQRCADQDISVSTVHIAETLTKNRAAIVAELIQPILWAFNYRMAKDTLAALVDQGLKTLRLL